MMNILTALTVVLLFFIVIIYLLFKYQESRQKKLTDSAIAAAKKYRMTDLDEFGENSDLLDDQNKDEHR